MSDPFDGWKDQVDKRLDDHDESIQRERTISCVNE